MTREFLASKIFAFRQALAEHPGSKFKLTDALSIFYREEPENNSVDSYIFAINNKGTLIQLATVPVNKLAYTPVQEEILADLRSYAPDEAIIAGSVTKIFNILTSDTARQSKMWKLTDNVLLLAYFLPASQIKTVRKWHFVADNLDYTCPDYALLDSNTLIAVQGLLSHIKAAVTENKEKVRGTSVVTLDVIKELFPPEGTNKNADALKKDFQDKDKMLVLLYFRWLTRKGARDMGLAHLEKSLEMSDATKAWLAEAGLSDIDDWEFTGMTDHGSVNAGITCSHGGHRLRYAYHAYSPSADKELLFGLNCGSEFFQVDLGVLSKLEVMLTVAKEELKASFAFGRCSAVLNYLPSYNILSNIRRSPELAELCLTYIGRTQFELWLNFINRGIVPPKTLANLVQSGYEASMQSYLQAHSSISKYLDIYRNVKVNETVGSNMDIRNNKGCRRQGEFIYPLTRCTLFDALKAVTIEELLNPSAISTCFNIMDFYTKIEQLESEMQAYTAEMGIPTDSRAEIIYAYALKNDKNYVHSPLDVLLLACNKNDLRLVQFFFGLIYATKGVEPTFRQEVWKGKSEYFLITQLHSRRRLLLLLFLGYYDDLISAIKFRKPLVYPTSEDEYSDYDEDLDDDFFKDSDDEEEEYYDEEDSDSDNLADGGQEDEYYDDEDEEVGSDSLADLLQNGGQDDAD